MQPSYFPPGSFSARPDLDEFDANWFGSYLKAMGERTLFPARCSPVTFRCLCLPTWCRPCVVRIEERGFGWLLSGQELTGDGGFKIGVVCRRIHRELSASESARIGRMLPYLRFWELCSTIDHDGFDGTTWVLEGAERYRYHIVQRWEPEWGDTFGEFCNLLLELAGLGWRAGPDDCDETEEA